MTVAEEVRAAADPYRKAIARMVYRRVADGVVTMFFEDGSVIRFVIRYELEDAV